MIPISPDVREVSDGQPLEDLIFQKLAYLPSKPRFSDRAKICFKNIKFPRGNYQPIVRRLYCRNKPQFHLLVSLMARDHNIIWQKSKSLFKPSNERVTRKGAHLPRRNLSTLEAKSSLPIFTSISFRRSRF